MNEYADVNPGRKLIIGISSCLIGQPVRYDGSSKHSRYITDTLGRCFEFRPYCPEVAIGLSIPRPPIRLVKKNREVRAVGIKDPNQDVTDDLIQFADSVSNECSDVCGYIFKSKSPSCGMERVKLFKENGDLAGTESGIFANKIMQKNPALPVEEEGRLMNPSLRENFVERVFVYARWLFFLRRGVTVANLVEFHTRHKFVVLAHDEPIYRELGRMVASAGSQNSLAERYQQYLSLLTEALKKLPTPKMHTNVLQHIFGFFKDNLSAEDKKELLNAIDEYRRGLLPLIVPITLIRHYLRLYPNDYIASQFYLSPGPNELVLRNQI